MTILTFSTQGWMQATHAQDPDQPFNQELVLNQKLVLNRELTLSKGEAMLALIPCGQTHCEAELDGQQLPLYALPSSANRNRLLIVAAPLDGDSFSLFRIRNSTDSNNSKSTPWINYTLKTREPDYPKETLTVNPGLVSPPDHARARIDREWAEIRAALSPVQKDTPITETLALPIVLKKITSPFGIRRLYNGELKSRHTGVDLRAAEGTPVKAPLAGIVKMAQFNWYSGGHIILEHGWGVTSSYFHLSELRVKKGDSITQGHSIALSGATGRVTGPHLHWGIHIDGIPVNPLQFREDLNKIQRQVGKPE